MVSTASRNHGRSAALLLAAIVVVAGGAFAIGQLLSGPGPMLTDSTEEVARLREDLDTLRVQVRDLEEQLRDVAWAPVVMADEGRSDWEDEAVGDESQGDGGDRRQRGDGEEDDGRRGPGRGGRGGFGWEEMQELRDAETDQDRLEAARKILESGNPMAQFEAIRTLLELSPAEGLEALRDLVESSGDDRRGGFMAGRAVAMLGDMDGIPRSELYSYADSENESVRMAALRALEQQGDSTLMERYLSDVGAGLADADGGLRARAVSELADSRSPAAVPYLLPMLGDANSDVRLRTLDALRRTAGQEAIPQVEALLNDPVAAVRDRAARTLEELSRPLEERQNDRGFGRGGFGGGRGGRGG